jgi:ribosomal protein S18 acetylase RimI-like enzyme
VLHRETEELRRAGAGPSSAAVGMNREMQIHIRRAEPYDATALAQVGRASFMETYAGQFPSADMAAHCDREHSVERYLTWLAGGAHRIWIVEAADQAPLGFAVVCAPDLPVATGSEDLELLRFYLLAQLHGTGLGGRLMRAVVNDAQTAGASRLLLGVYTGNARAIAFYTRQGFAQAGVRKYRVGEGVYDDLVLARSLDPPAT